MTNGTGTKKGLSTWAKVAIGCAGVVILCFIAFVALGVFAFQKGKEAVKEATGVESFRELAEDFQANPAKAAAETAVRLNPELELISSDEDAGTISFRNSRTGEEATLNFEDIAEGRFSMVTDEGEYKVDAAGAGEGGVTFSGPEGETRYGASADLGDVPDWVPRYPGATDAKSVIHTTSSKGLTGTFTSKSTDDAQKVVDHFKQLFADGGYKIGSESMTRTGDGAFGAITGQLDGRSVNVVIVENAGASQVTINYGQKQQ